MNEKRSLLRQIGWSEALIDAVLTGKMFLEVESWQSHEIEMPSSDQTNIIITMEESTIHDGTKLIDRQRK